MFKGAKHSEETKAKIRLARAKQIMPKGMGKGRIPWNKGLTKETNATVKLLAEKTSIRQIGQKRKPLSEEAKRKLSEARKGELNTAKRPEVREKIRQSVLQLYKDHPEILENRKRCGRNQHSGEFSSIEKKIVDMLNKHRIGYLHNHKIGRFWADFLVFDRVIIECDGSYWHRDKEKEKRRDLYLYNRGYFIFHFTEEDINKDPEGLVERLISLWVGFLEEARISPEMDRYKNAV